MYYLFGSEGVKGTLAAKYQQSWCKNALKFNPTRKIIMKITICCACHLSEKSISNLSFLQCHLIDIFISPNTD